MYTVNWTANGKNYNFKTAIHSVALAKFKELGGNASVIETLKHGVALKTETFKRAAFGL